jgi:putative transposase
LFEARKRLRLCVLNYQVTHNHIHLLAIDRGRGEIPTAMQLIAGRTAQEYNRRKGRHGAFWEDRYHATIVDTENHLLRCLVYIDLNMVRAGVVSHPREWDEAGYHEIQRRRERYRIIDRAALSDVLEIAPTELADCHRQQVEESIVAGGSSREPCWSSAIAVGGSAFIEGVQRTLGDRSKYRRVELAKGRYMLQEALQTYGHDTAAETARLSIARDSFCSQSAVNSATSLGPTPILFRD